jgi:hypothetical protein
LKRAGLPKGTRFHDLRHACASLLLAAGTDVKVVSERLGHGSTSFTMDTYQHVLPGLQQDAANRLRDILKPPVRIDANPQKCSQRVANAAESGEQVRTDALENAVVPDSGG